jgi:hypothetical protein
MAESQVPFEYTPEAKSKIRAALSEPRFQTYMKAAGHDEDYAIALYLFNARLSKAFLFPLHVVEVSLRNAIDELLCTLYGNDWTNSTAFFGILSVESAASLTKAKDRARSSPRSQIVATLTFDFWSNLFRPEYDRPLWQVNLHRTLPNCPAHFTRPDVQSKVRGINQFRNRIAHHEPIFDADITALHTLIGSVVGMRCAIVETWLKQHSTVSKTVRTRPKRGGGSTEALIDRCDTRFQIVAGSDSLALILSKYEPNAPAIIKLDANGAPTAALTTADIMLFAQAKASDVAGMIDFNEHTVDDVITAQGLATSFVLLDSKVPLSVATDQLRKKDVRVVVATENVSGNIVAKGAILRAHRRY